MDKIDLILNNDKFKNNLLQNVLLEKDREYCKHDLEHFLSVARIAYILCLEEDLKIDKEMIYAASLLHDIGKNVQYEKGIPHEAASVSIAEDILINAGFDENEKSDIIEAIKHHRVYDENVFNSLIYRADKLSRNCFNCIKFDECNWNDEEKNKSIKI